jgi:hypothetical protein
MDGTELAASVAAINTPMTAAMVAGSRGVTPYRMELI